MTTPPPNLAPQTARLLLETLQQVSGAQYPKLLQQAGLARFTPGADLLRHPGPLTTSEVQNLLQVIWTQLGEGLFRLYEQNMGMGMAVGFVQGPAGAALRAAVQALPPDRQLAAAVQGYYQQLVQSSPHSALQEEATAWQLTFAPCMACLGLTGAQAPVCASVGIVTQQLLAHAIERRVKVTEIACHAQGAPACVFAVAK